MIQHETSAAERFEGVEHAGGVGIGKLSRQLSGAVEVRSKPDQIGLLFLVEEARLLTAFDDQAPFVVVIGKADTRRSVGLEFT
jgi:hypothetical protein